jgi:general secretion pathway protein H
VRARGFTVLELLVVLLVMGIAAGLASVAARPDDRALLRVEADRLALLLELAGAEARDGGRAIAWSVNGTGYRFWRHGGDAQWIEIRDGELLRARVLPPGMRIAALRIDNAALRDPIRLVFSPYVPAPAFSIELAMGDARWALAATPLGDIEVVPGGGT